MKCYVCGKELEPGEVMWCIPTWGDGKMHPCHRGEAVHMGISNGRKAMGKEKYEDQRRETIRLLLKMLQAAGVKVRDLRYERKGNEEIVVAYFYNDKSEKAIVTKENLAGMVYETMKQIPELQWGH